MNEVKKGNQKFYIGDDEAEALGVIEYQEQGEKVLVANHTYVNPSLRGQGIAKMLLDALVDFARKENKKIIPVCSYVKAEFERNKGYHDVIFTENDKK
jgi:predicted GNAT family acetyltransferase